MPGSSVYDFIDGLIPRAEDTYQRLAEMIEKEETEKVNKEISARKSRLGATTGSVTVEVKREVYASSPVRAPLETHMGANKAVVGGNIPEYNKLDQR